MIEDFKKALQSHTGDKTSALEGQAPAAEEFREGLVQEALSKLGDLFKGRDRPARSPLDHDLQL